MLLGAFHIIATRPYFSLPGPTRDLSFSPGSREPFAYFYTEDIAFWNVMSGFAEPKIVIGNLLVYGSLSILLWLLVRATRKI